MKPENEFNTEDSMHEMQKMTDEMMQERIAILNQQKEVCPETDTVQFEKRTYTVDEIQDILGISRTSAYNLVKKGVFRSVRIGGSIRISKKSFDAWLDGQI